MAGRYRTIIGVILGILTAVAATAAYLHHRTVAVLQPRGPIGHQERGLMFFALWLSAIVVIPVYILAIGIVLKYRESNHKAHARYRPNWDHSRLLETIWWGVPIMIIAILSVVTWQSSHALDPYKPLNKARPLTIDVVNLDWKWLFIYPQQHIASVNLVQFPVGQPVNFYITSDSVMNSFWIPQLSGQIYAMPGMVSQLHIQADKTGDYYGTPANIAGKGFAGMTFTARASLPLDFDNWVASARAGTTKLDLAGYNRLAKPSQNDPVSYYAAPSSGLFNYIVMKYMTPGAAS